jgi:hypothetical protein
MKKRRIKGSGAKNLALLQNKCKPSQLGKLIVLTTGKIRHKGKNYSSKLRNIIFATEPNNLGTFLQST